MQNSVYPEITETRQNVHLLTFPGDKKLYLIGTAHVSQSSVELVESLINEVRPDTIAIELDEKRSQRIMMKNIFDDIDIVEIIREKQLFFFIGQFIMASFQKKISEKTGTSPGSEFRKAIELSRASGARLVLADRDVGVTLKRAWRLTPLRDKMKFLGGLLFSSNKELENLDIEELKKSDAIDTIVKSFSDELPVTKKVLIDERDDYLSNEIEAGLGETTVAVVGAGHVPGILNRLNGTIKREPDNEQINTVPKPSRAGKIIPWIIPTVIIAGFIYKIAFGNIEVAKDAIVFWVLANGILTALGCLLSLSHPLTAVAGFIAAPITSLNPTIGAGFVTALVQTLLSRPRVRDFNEIQNGALGITDWWKNRVTKIFLVFILSSIGSSIGTFVALPYLTRLFAG